jgi:hypothetical protein
VSGTHSPAAAEYDAEQATRKLGGATGADYADDALTAHLRVRAKVRGRVRQIWRWEPVAEPAGAPPAQEPTAGQQLARELIAAGIPAYYEVPVHEPPALTGNLIVDVCRLTGTRRVELAEAFGVKERTVYNWQRSGASPGPDVERGLRALRAIAITLFGGLGAKGVGRWLAVGEPSRLLRLARDDAPEEVLAAARSYVNGEG